jgi:hypothetical protein
MRVTLSRPSMVSAELVPTRPSAMWHRTCTSGILWGGAVKSSLVQEECIEGPSPTE